MSGERSERLVVCGTCGDVVGPAEDPPGAEAPRIQAGTCPAHAIPEQPRWPRHDFNRFVELCRCCGTVPMKSGSRWSTWFCPACREEVDLLNQRLGRYAIPIGRHSVHAGRLLTRESLADPLEVEIFTSATNAAFDAIRVLSRWARHVVRLNLRAIREDDDAVVPIRQYCLSAQRYVLPSDRFREMCAWLTHEGRALHGPALPPTHSDFGELT